MRTFPAFQLPTIDLSSLDLGKLDPRNIDLPYVDLPTAERLIDLAKNATLAGSGLVSLAAERIAEVQKRVLDILTRNDGPAAI